MITDEVLAYIPQRPPFVFVSALESYSQNEGTCSYIVTDSSPLVNNGAISIGGIIEHMAQSCALYMGYRNGIARANAPLMQGVIGALSCMEFFSCVSVGETLRSDVVIIGEYGSMVMAEVTSSSAGRLVAKGTLKVSLTVGEQDI